jgi:hypothetical protein
MQQRNLEKYGNFGKKVSKTLCWTRWRFWNQTGGLLEMSSNELVMF